MPKQQYSVGIDGGGTKSVICLIDQQGQILQRALFGPTNYARNQEGPLAKRIAQAVRSICKHLPPGEKLDCLGVGLSGLGQPELKERIRLLLSAMSLAKTVHVENDAVAALHGAFGGSPGIILIGGTGSIAFGQTAEGRQLRCGGWGYLLGDEGSGFDIGRRAITAALQDWDGRGEKTLLREALEKRFEVESIDKAVPGIYAEMQSRGEIANIAREVFDAFDAGDSAARKILQHAATAMAELVMALTRRLALTTSVPVALVGSLFRRRELFVPRFEACWQQSGLRIHLQDAANPPEFGAAMLAFKAAGIDFSG